MLCVLYVMYVSGCFPVINIKYHPSVMIFNVFIHLLNPKKVCTKGKVLYFSAR